MNKNLRWGWGWGWGWGWALLLAACATGDSGSTAGQTVAQRRAAVALQSKREAALQPTWRGQPYEALHDARGPPTMMLKVPSGRPWVTLVAVYGMADKVSGCVDAYPLVLQQQTRQWSVADYFCR